MTNSNDTAATLADLKRRLAELGDGRDARSDRERETHVRTFHDLIRRTTIIQSAMADLVPINVEAASLTTWIDHLKTWRTEFAQALTALPTVASERTPDEEKSMMGLMLAIKNIDFGCEYWPNQRAMLAAPLREQICATYSPTWEMETLDPWRIGHGALPHAERRLARLVAERDELQRRLDDAIREPNLVAV